MERTVVSASPPESIARALTPLYREHMRKLKALLTLLLLFAGAMPGIADEAPEGDNNPYPIWLSPRSPINSLDEIDKAWSGPLGKGVRGRAGGNFEWNFYKGEGADRNTAIADSCETIFALENQGYRASPGVDRTFYREQRNGCDFMVLLRTARPAKRSFVRDFELNENSIHTLPAFTGLGISCDMMCRFETADRLAIPLSRFWQLTDVSSIDKNRLRFHEDKTKFDVYILAKGDFDGDGLEDLFLNRSYYYIDVFAYTGNKNLIVTRERSGAVLRMVNIESYLCRPKNYRCEETHTDLSHWLDADR